MNLDGLGLSGSANTQGAELDASTYALWRFDESTLPQFLTITDSGPSAAHLTGGTVTTTPRVAPGPVAGTYSREVVSSSYNGPINNASPGAATAMFQAADWTVEAYIYLDALPSSEGAIYCYGAAGETQAANVQCSFLVVSTGKLRTRWESGAGVDRVTTQVAGGALVAGTWYHVAAVKTGGNVLFYIDGVLQDTVAYAANADGGGSAYHFGFGTEIGTVVIPGRIAGIRISSAALSGATIAADAALISTTCDMGVIASTAFYWKCQEAVADSNDAAGRLPISCVSSGTTELVCSPLVNPNTGYSRAFTNASGTQQILAVAGATAVPGWATNLCTVLRGECTFEFWVFPLLANQTAGIFFLDGGAGVRPALNYFSIQLQCTSDNFNIRYQYETGGGPTVVTYDTGTIFTAAQVLSGDGVHIGCVKTTSAGSAIYKTYLNGVLIETSAAKTQYDGTGSTDMTLTIGDFVGSTFLRGRIDDFRISNVARSTADILATYTRGAGGGVIAKRPHP
jgi:hypothetical protein